MAGERAQLLSREFRRGRLRASSAINRHRAQATIARENDKLARRLARSRPTLPTVRQMRKGYANQRRYQEQIAQHPHRHRAFRALRRGRVPPSGFRPRWADDESDSYYDDE